MKKISQTQTKKEGNRMLTKEKVIEALKNVVDWEIGADVVSLGLIYDVTFPDEDTVHVLMTLTTPGCPLIYSLVAQVEQEVKKLGVKKVDVEITFDPPWDPSRMTPELKRRFGIE